MEEWERQKRIEGYSFPKSIQHPGRFELTNQTKKSQDGDKNPPAAKG